MTHLGFDVDSPFWRHWLAGLSRPVTRWCGTTPAAAACPAGTCRSLGFEDWVRDLELVADALGLRRFPLIGLSHGGAVAIGYAARHPERVSHLVLVGACARGATAAAAAGTQRWPPLDELPRRTTSPANTARFHEALADVDVRRAAARRRVPDAPAALPGGPGGAAGVRGRAGRRHPGQPAGPVARAAATCPRQHEAAWPVLLAEAASLPRRRAAAGAATARGPSGPHPRQNVRRRQIVGRQRS